MRGTGAGGGGEGDAAAAVACFFWGGFEGVVSDMFFFFVFLWVFVFVLLSRLSVVEEREKRDGIVL